MSRSDHSWVERVWYGRSPLYWLLLPLTWLYSAAIATRSFLYAKRIFQAYRVAAPVIVIGNISVGGTGKTPLTIWLARALRERGLRPAIISRGYRGNVGSIPVQATADGDPAVVGDEAILLAAHSGCPVVVHPERVAAANKALELGADIILADDGLQHYRLQRDLEIAVIDGSRGFGNGKLLPAGPLREPITRLETVDKVLVHRHENETAEVLRRASDRRPLVFSLRVTRVTRLDNSESRRIGEFAGSTVHAVAGIGNPERFFRMLESHGIAVQRHALRDHANIGPDDIAFDDDLDVLMTEKDAVKCRWPDSGNCWYVSVDVVFDNADAGILLELVLDTVPQRKPT